MKYERKLYASGLVVIGSFLLVEHIYNFGFEIFDFLGHEWLGLILILSGIILSSQNTGLSVELIKIKDKFKEYWNA